MNSIKILFFANLHDHAGTNSIQIDIPIGATVNDLKVRLADDYPNLKPAMGTVLVAVNREYAFDIDIIPEDAEVAIFPPVSGG